MVPVDGVGWLLRNPRYKFEYDGAIGVVQASFELILRMDEPHSSTEYENILYLEDGAAQHIVDLKAEGPEPGEPSNSILPSAIRGAAMDLVNQIPAYSVYLTCLSAEGMAELGGIPYRDVFVSVGNARVDRLDEAGEDALLERIAVCISAYVKAHKN
jgi:hypothetical protein